MSLLMSLSRFVTPIYTGINLRMHRKLALPGVMHYENFYCTFFSAADDVRHSVRLGAELFPMLFGLLLLIVYLVLSLLMTMCALFPISAIS